MRTRKVAVLGATGLIGQRFVRRLAEHPWFEVAAVLGSDARRGRPYGEAVHGGEAEELPVGIRDLAVQGLEDPFDADLVFSALPSGTAGPAERALAARGLPVFTNAADLRTEPDVPILIPEVNPDHLELVRERAGGLGYVVAGGNCTSVVLTLALKPLHDRFGVAACSAVSFQALSGAGHPGVPALDALANVVPYIPGEEAKLESEPRKILGTLRGGGIEPAGVVLSATCARVPVLEGHTVAATVRLDRAARDEEIINALSTFEGDAQVRGLPSAPARPVTVRPEPDRPQPRRDWAAGDGMVVSVGRLRADPVLGWKFVVTGSNSVRGAAGGTILAAELAIARGLA